MNKLYNFINILLFIILIFSLIVWCVYIYFYRFRDRIVYTPNLLKRDAKIIDIDTKRVGSKSSIRYLTTFTFDDGFKYVSRKTHVDNHFFFTRISLSKEDILELASFAYYLHKKIADSDSSVGSKEISISIKEPLFSNKEEHTSSIADDENNSVDNFPVCLVVTIAIITIICIILYFSFFS